MRRFHLQALFTKFCLERNSSNDIKTTSFWHLSGTLNVLSFDKMCSLDGKWLPHITFNRREKFLAFQRHCFQRSDKSNIFQKTLLLPVSWGSYKSWPAASNMLVCSHKMPYKDNFFWHTLAHCLYLLLLCKWLNVLSFDKVRPTKLGRCISWAGHQLRDCHLKIASCCVQNSNFSQNPQS